jgi:hypothetical protein
LTQVATQRGIGFEVVRTWPGGRELERRLKDRHDAPRLCPVCNPAVLRQLQLGLDEADTLDDFPPPPDRGGADAWEIMTRRRWRAARPVAIAIEEDYDL